MANRFQIGEIDVLAVSDGDGRAPGPVYFQGTTPEQWAPHKRWLDHAGMVVFPFTCFAVRSGGKTVLIDTGLGPIDLYGFRGGQLLNELSAADVRPEDIDTVFVTHLHVDHCGTVALPEGEALKLTFPRATYRWTADEHAYWSGDAAGQPLPQAQQTQKILRAVGDRFQPADGGDLLAPGVNVMATPGHTPGHASVVLSSGSERAFILGDAISCPVQVEEPEWSGMGDIDPKLARRTQEAVLREAEGDGSLLTAAHFPGLTFGRVLRGEGRRYWAPV